MKERELFTMKEMDINLIKNVKISISITNLRNQTMLFDSLHIYLQHIIIIHQQKNAKSNIAQKYSPDVDLKGFMHE